jgi:RHH-type proline utilization regulon transcriptional repressor/proline dehydrogenase/delta 1-pyrroline-5-carboxylate dehydrogenase
MSSAAIVTGNPVLYKPAGPSSVVGFTLAEIFRKAGLPDGVFNYVPGRGSVMGDYLVEHPDIALIAFTGSLEVGRRILNKASVVQPGQKQMKRVIAELGGKNAIIIDDDADLDEAVREVLSSAFAFQGQKCSACSRVIVVEPIYEKFIHRLTEGAKSLAIGPAEDPTFFMGPVVDDKARQSILQYAELAKKEGRLLFESAVPEKGFYVPLTIVDGITPEHRIAQEEVFGPVLAVMKVKDFDQALEWANSTAYALTGAVFSRSPRHLEKAGREFNVGNLYLNRGSTGALVERHPFGGFHMSGIGSKTGGPDYLLQFMDPRVICENTMRRGFAPIEADDDWID